MLKITKKQITPEWLTNCLRRYEHLPQGEVTSINIKASYKHHFELEVAYSDDAPDPLPRDFILKWYSGGYGTREGFFFHQIVPAMSAPPVPTCYYVGVDRDRGQTTILLEDLSATHCTASPPYRDLDSETFEQVMQALLKIHGHWWDHPQIGQESFLRDAGMGVAHEAISSETIRENERYFTEVALSAREDQHRDMFPVNWQKFFEMAIASWADLFIRRISAGTNLTVIQGDAQLGNTLLPRDRRRDRPIIIDWEGCTRGLGVWDLARTLVQTEFPSDQRMELERKLLPRYQSQLTEYGIKDYSIDDCMADYRLCVLANIPHALVWESHSYLESAMRAFRDWKCDELLD
jgi:thiamine kinase-like enzyme